LGKKTQKNIGTFFKAPTATKKADITFNEVFNAFLEIGHTSGNNSVMTKENIITRILQHADNLDAKYIVRWL
jgi:ATP-dependent DNA ligase